MCDERLEGTSPGVDVSDSGLRALITGLGLSTASRPLFLFSLGHEFSSGRGWELGCVLLES